MTVHVWKADPYYKEYDYSLSNWGFRLAFISSNVKMFKDIYRKPKNKKTVKNFLTNYFILRAVWVKAKTQNYPVPEWTDTVDLELDKLFKKAEVGGYNLTVYANATAIWTAMSLLGQDGLVDDVMQKVVEQLHCKYYIYLEDFTDNIVKTLLEP